MRITRHLFVALALVTGLAVLTPPGIVAASGRVPSWGRVTYLPGVPAGSSTVSQAACTAPGNCTVVGVYPTDNPHTMFVSTEVRGHWGPARVLITGHPRTEANALSCPDVRDCVVAGVYQSADQMNQYSFIDSEVSGSWGTPQVVSLPNSTGVDPNGGVATVACASAGNCVVGGSDIINNDGWVETESGGVWSAPVILGSLASMVEYAACPVAGNCTVTGMIGADGGVFVDNFSNGVWQPPVEIANLIVPINVQRSEGAAVDAISCVGVNYCVIGGDYPVDRSPSLTFFQQPFVAVERNGVWGAAQPVPGAIAANIGGVGATTNVQCWAVDRCVLAGFYGDHPYYRPWEDQSSGSGWGAFVEPQRQGGGSNYGLPVGFGCASPTVCVQIGSTGMSEAIGIDNGLLGTIIGNAMVGYSWGGRWTAVHYLFSPWDGFASWTYVQTTACAPTGVYCLVGGGRELSKSATLPYHDQRAFVVAFS